MFYNTFFFLFRFCSFCWLVIIHKRRTKFCWMKYVETVQSFYRNCNFVMRYCAMRNLWSCLHQWLKASVAFPWYLFRCKHRPGRTKSPISTNVTKEYLTALKKRLLIHKLFNAICLQMELNQSSFMIMTWSNRTVQNLGNADVNISYQN